MTDPPRPERHGKLSVVEVRTPWTCPRCHANLGMMTPGGVLLHLTTNVAMVEPTRLASVIRCKCGQVKAFTGSVRYDPPDAA